MEFEKLATAAMEQLLRFSTHWGLIDPEDVPYCRNLLLDMLGMEAPAEVTVKDEPVPETATKILGLLCDLAAQRGLIEAGQTAAELFSARLMGAVTPSPRAVRQRFAALLESEGPQAATDWFYDLCRRCDYIKVNAIGQNIRYFSPTDVGELEITINLSKPEKDPREIAKLKNAPQVGYPRCMLCVENPGYAGRMNFPARQNHRMVPLTLDGAAWYLQYSPYAYYPEHCIVLNRQHVPMKVDRGTFRRLFDFVGQYPHYFLGSNADLPIVGGSILNHDHFQGGRHDFPMDRAGTWVALKSPTATVQARLLDWPMTTLELQGSDADALVEAADQVLTAWRGWSDEDCAVAACDDDGTPHNTITPILRRVGASYRLRLVLRNNRVSEEHPLGIFHPHAPLHHIKRENIGLIEVMGLFILPGRLKTELALLAPYLTGEKPLVRPAPEDPCEKHYDWLCALAANNPRPADEAEAMALLRREVGNVCAQVLKDAGVYKQDEAGRAGVLRFLAACGYTEK